ncbi:rod shape-determining protein MreD [Marinicauda algicola]|uniref:Rod shape-determining protein MreD n=1 Tax=Marinicauda algicola TaxID=2029849 RepID=A0A4S2GYK3_9PROT|nr:rod shape-determining protein MreD [Marinicauda algicola]TGY88277.1 rod shape-determining protein MreD [Marinicauda algicola]
MRAPLERRSAWPTVVAMTLTLLASLLIHAAPTRLPTGADILPLLPLITLFIWAVRRPRYVSPLLIFAVGLLQDLLIGGPMGVWALSYLVAFAIARPREEEGGGELGPMSLRFAVLTLIALTLAWGAGSVALGQPAATADLVTEGILTIILFPGFAFLFARKKERTTFS